MGIADFFDKTALAASQMLRRYDREQFIARLEDECIGVVLDHIAISSEEGCYTLDLLVRLLVRLWPRMSILDLGNDESATAVDLRELARRINPNITIEDVEESTCVAVVGSSSFESGGTTFYLGSTGWSALFGIDAPVPCGSSKVPFGAGAAACFGAANIFRHVFAEDLPGGDCDAPFCLSLLTYEAVEHGEADITNVEIDLGDTHLIGLGAIGHGFLWAIANLPKIEGSLHLVDGEDVALSNLQRYVLTERESESEAKSNLAASYLRGHKLDVIPIESHLAEYLDDRNDWNVETFVVCVDSAEDRIAAQAALPKRLFNAWTQAEDLGVSRHFDFLEDACLACLYLPQSEEPSLSEVVADAIGFSGQERQVRELLYQGTPLNAGLLQAIAGTNGVDVEPLMRFEGESLHVFYSQAVCGGLLLRLGSGSGNETDVPMAFQSALAGIMLAADLVAETAGLRPEGLPTSTRIDLRRPRAPRLCIPRQKDPQGSCICQDDDYRAIYQEKWCD